MQAQLPIRAAQRALTRNRISDAARDLFFTNGYFATTLDQIAAHAGTRRSTLYTHFRDKEDILRLIADDYSEGLTSVVRRLPGPVPTRAEIDRWMIEIADFVMRERTPTVLLNHLGGFTEVPEPAAQLGERLIAALADKVIAFRRAVEPGPLQHEATAWAAIVMRELCWASLRRATHGDDDLSRARFSVIGDILERFVTQSA